MSAGVCTRCGESKELLATPPMPGEAGREVAGRVCAECWAEWVHTSIRVVNHYALQAQSKEHREALFDLMRDFLKLPKKQETA